jgi:hypothetical protein
VRNEIVHFACDRELTGEIVPVVVRRAYKNSLGAEVDPTWLSSMERRATALARSPERRSLPVAP